MQVGAVCVAGRIIALGPNIHYLPGEYWDSYEHYLGLTELLLWNLRFKLRGLFFGSNLSLRPGKELKN
jgi:hypothetical protein